MTIQATFRFLKQAQLLKSHDCPVEFTLHIHRDETIEKIKQRVYEQFWKNGQNKLPIRQHGQPDNLTFWAHGSGKVIRTIEEFRCLCPKTTDKVEIQCELRFLVAVDRQHQLKNDL